MSDYQTARDEGSHVLASLRNVLGIPAKKRPAGMVEGILRGAADALAGLVSKPIPMRLVCPRCGQLHVDEGVFATKVHHTHACQHCGEVWRPAVVPTVGVRFLPGFKNEET